MNGTTINSSVLACRALTDVTLRCGALIARDNLCFNQSVSQLDSSNFCSRSLSSISKGSSILNLIACSYLDSIVHLVKSGLVCTLHYLQKPSFILNRRWRLATDLVKHSRNPINFITNPADHSLEPVAVKHKAVRSHEVSRLHCSQRNDVAM